MSMLEQSRDRTGQNNTGLNNTAQNGTAGGQQRRRPFSPLGDVGEIHELTMIVVWMVAMTIGLWSMAFKQYRWAIYVHFFAMGVVTVINWMSGFLAIINFGVNHRIGPVHTWLGIAILIASALQCISGMICWFFQKGYKIRPFFIVAANYIHTLFGWAIFIAVLVQILLFTRKKLRYFLPVIIISLISFVVYLLVKFLRKRIQLSRTPPSLPQATIPMITSTKELSHLNGDYFIFQDKVYDLNNVLGYHPGGYELIRKIRSREVQRFMYGAETLEDEKSIDPYLHMSNSLAMAGRPLAIVAAHNPYQNLLQSTNAVVYQVTQPCGQPSIYAPYLVSQNPSMPFMYQGYSHLSQLGKYFIVTIDSFLRNKTRQYSMVNFMHPSNINLMNQIMGRTNDGFDSHRSATGIKSTQHLNVVDHVNSIPLLIKKYKSGEFTSKFLDGIFSKEVRISNPYGFGLSLHEMPINSQLIFFAGGTGIYPFCDTIDLLYKQALVKQGSVFSNQILALNPILRQDTLLSRFRITLFYSIRTAQQLLQTVGQQLNYLGNSKILTSFLRITINPEAISRRYPGINLIQKTFEEFIPDIARRIDYVGQVYLCGPGNMTSGLMKSLLNNFVPATKVRIL